MFDFQHIHAAGAHKLAQLHEDARTRAAATKAETTEERPLRRTARLLGTLRLIVS